MNAEDNRRPDFQMDVRCATLHGGLQNTVKHFHVPDLTGNEWKRERELLLGAIDRHRIQTLLRLPGQIHENH